MSKPDVLMPGAYPAPDMAALEASFTLHRMWEAPNKDAFLKDKAPVIRGIATRGDLGASAEMIAALPNLEVIACNGVGVDAVDLAAARAAGVAVTNTPDVLSGDVADMTLLLMLATARKLPQADRFTRGGDWAKGGFGLAHRMFGKRLGIVGLGRIGQEIAKRARAFDMEIAYTGRSEKPDLPFKFYPDPVALAAASDFLVVIVPGGAATNAMIGTDVFEALGPEGIFVNIARGSVVDEAALLDALEQNRIRGAGLDVFNNEPDIDPRFLKLENVVLQPHQGSATGETRRAMGQLVIDNLEAHFSGKPLLTPVG